MEPELTANETKVFEYLEELRAGVGPDEQINVSIAGAMKALGMTRDELDMANEGLVQLDMVDDLRDLDG